MAVRDMLRTGDPMHMFSVFLVGIHPIALSMTRRILLVSRLLGLRPLLVPQSHAGRSCAVLSCRI